MKNTQPSLSIRPRGTGSDRPDERTASSMAYASRCHNLRCHSSCGIRYMAPVGVPATLAETDATPFFTFTADNGRAILLLHRGETLMALADGEKSPAVIGHIDGQPLCAIQSGNSVVVMTSRGRMSLKYTVDGSWYVADETTVPVIRIIAGESRDFESIVAPRQFATPYTRWGGSLDAADISAITADLIGAYRECVAKAAEAGYFLQPVAACYALDTTDTAAMSAPVMVSANGFQPNAPIEVNVVANGTSYGGIAGYAVRLRGYRIAMEAVGTNDYSGPIHLHLSPQLHPIDPERNCSYRALSGISGPTLRLWLPGTAEGGAISTWRYSMMLAAAASRLRGTATAYTLNVKNPAGIIADDIRPAAERQLDDELRGLSTFLSRKADMGPSTFMGTAWNAAVAHPIGDTVTWGNISSHPCPAHPLPMFAATTRAGSWHGYVAVTLGQRRGRVVWSGEGRGDTPDTLQPLLSYPDPSAIEMTVAISSGDGTVRRATFPLTPDEGGTMALYMQPEGKAISLPTVEEDYIIPAMTATAEHYPGMILTASIDAPLTPVAAVTAVEGAVTAICRPVKSTGALDFTRSRLYLFATSGIYLLSVSSVGGALSSRRIDRHPVTSSDHVAETHSGVVAVSGNSMLLADGNRVTVLCRGVDYRSIAYNAAYDELLAIRADGSLTARDMTGGDGHSLDLRPTALYTDHRLLMTASGRLLDASRESTAVSMPVAWEGGLSQFPFAPLAVKGVEWIIDSREADLRVRLRGASGGDDPLTLLELHAVGAINASLRARVFAPCRGRLSASIEGTVSPDMRFYGLTLYLHTDKKNR